jgi:hypothetical protein
MLLAETPDWNARNKAGLFEKRKNDAKNNR